MKTVLLPIIVPEGNACALGEQLEHCEYFDNEGGHAHCSLGLYNERSPDGVYLKGDVCRKLKRA